MAILCAAVMRGNKNPEDVLVTSSFAAGLVVPMPTLPPLITTVLSGVLYKVSASNVQSLSLRDAMGVQLPFPVSRSEARRVGKVVRLRLSPYL